MEELVINNPESVLKVNRGLDVILSYDNIAIVVLMVVALMESAMIYYLLRSQFRKFDRITDVLHKLHTSITILNERLGHTYHDRQDTT
jgi:hypothetical protein